MPTFASYVIWESLAQIRVLEERSRINHFSQPHFADCRSMFLMPTLGSAKLQENISFFLLAMMGKCPRKATSFSGLRPTPILSSTEVRALDEDFFPRELLQRQAG